MCKLFLVSFKAMLKQFDKFVVTLSTPFQILLVPSLLSSRPDAPNSDAASHDKRIPSLLPNHAAPFWNKTFPSKPAYAKSTANAVLKSRVNVVTTQLSDIDTA